MDLRSNQQLEFAYEFIEKTGKNVFLTGKAGTGKTTFLRNLKRSLSKRMIVVAPTGVAAINAGGVTIHSFFQLPFGPQLPSGNGASLGQTSNQNTRFQRFSREKIDIIKSLDLLVIDEVSMVRADLLDGIDGVLKRFKNRSKPFGGVQLLMIGDLQQLAPIAKDDEWAILKNYYDTVFFFSSKALQQSDYISIELKEIFRQSDQVFIDLLNAVRNNELTESSIKLLNNRHVPNFLPSDNEGYITLTTHNHQAQSINLTKLNALKSKSEIFTAEVEGDFPEHAFPTEFELTLKEGAQVMFVKNDPSYAKQFFNGKIGTLVAIEEDILFVQCQGDPAPIEVTPLEWHNTKYTIDNTTKEIKESIAGKFVQYPLKLAWAITIHKSQGLTFDKAIIDAQAAFAHGQVYVALSRCRSLEGIVLSSPIGTRSIISDNTVVGFNKSVEVNQPTEEHLKSAQIVYQRELLLELFDFSNTVKHFSNTLYFVKSNRNSFQPNLNDEISKINDGFTTIINEVAQKFTLQIVKMIDDSGMVEANSELQSRVIKAIEYFLPRIENGVIDSIDGLSIECDNKEIRSRLKEYLESIAKDLNQKIICLRSCEQQFSVTKYISARAEASIENLKRKKSDSKKSDSKKSKEINGPSSNPDVFLQLKEWRNSVAKTKGIPVYRVLKQSAMLQIADELPYTRDLLKSIKGIGAKKISEFGEEILSLVISFRDKRGLSTPHGNIFDSKEPTKPQKVKTHVVTYELFRQGKTISQIALERDLAESTIASHLNFYIESGELKIEELVSEEVIGTITDYFLNAEDNRLGPARDVLGINYSYHELRWVLLHLQKTGKIVDLANKNDSIE